MPIVHPHNGSYFHNRGQHRHHHRHHQDAIFTETIIHIHCKHHYGRSSLFLVRATYLLCCPYFEIRLIGAVICYIQVYVSNSTVAATVYFMAAIAVFRSLHVCYPVKYAKLCAPKWMITLCSTFWMVPLILCAAFDNGVEYDTNKFVCVFKSFRYLYALGLIVYVPSFSIMIIAYGKMFYTVKQCRRRIQAIGTVTTGAVIIHKDKHVFKMVIAITLIFLGSIGFPNLFYSVSLGCGSCRKCVMELIGSWLVRLRPTMNFIAILVTCRFLRNIVWSQICIYIESIFDMFI